MCNQAKACPESRGIATVSLVWRISIVMSISSQTTQCTRSYSNLTRKRLIAQYAIPLVLRSRRVWSLCRSTFVSVVLFHEGNVDQNSHIWLCAYIRHVLAVTSG